MGRRGAEQVAWACRRIRRLEAALEASRPEHEGWGPGCPAATNDGPCNPGVCDASERNAAIDAALVEES